MRFQGPSSPQGPHSGGVSSPIQESNPRGRGRENPKGFPGRSAAAGRKEREILCKLCAMYKKSLTDKNFCSKVRSLHNYLLSASSTRAGACGRGKTFSGAGSRGGFVPVSNRPLPSSNHADSRRPGLGQKVSRILHGLGPGRRPRSRPPPRKTHRTGKFRPEPRFPPFHPSVRIFHLELGFPWKRCLSGFIPGATGLGIHGDLFQVAAVF